MRLSLDISKSQIASFNKTVDGFETTVKHGIRKAMLFVEGESKKSFNKAGNLRVRSGKLRNSIASGAYGMVGWVGTNVVYGPTHEFGATIHAKKGSYLRFQIAGQWRTVKQVVIPKRPFLEPAMFNNRDKIIDIIADEIMEALDK